MKTLDEVIKALEVCTSDHGGCEGCPYDPDRKPDKKWDEALYYLKEYRGDTDNFEYRIEISYPNCDLQKLRYPAIMVDLINCENGIGLLMESLGFTNKVNPGGQIGWVKNGAVFASWEKVRIKDSNPPLTWDELKAMEGKPVWLEEIENDKILFGQWDIISGFGYSENFDLINYENPIIDFYRSGNRTKFGLDKTWQAYRKERDEAN